MTTNQPELSLLIDLVSCPAADLSEPAPNDDELGQILQAAMSAPDHGSLGPYRFIVIRGEARQELASVFKSAATERGLDAAAVSKQEKKPLRSPLIVAVVAHLQDNPAIPEIEQILSAGCAAQHIQLACRLCGYASIWLTGDNCYDQNVYQSLGLDFNERLVGFIYIGTPKTSQDKKPRPSAQARTEFWTQPQAADFAI